METMMRKRTFIPLECLALVLALVAMLFVSAASALAFEPLPVSKVEPTNGATVAPGELETSAGACVRFGIASTAGLEYLENNPEKGLWPSGEGVIVIVAAQDITDESGVLAPGVREEELLLEPGAVSGSGPPGTYRGITCKEPGETPPAAFSPKHLHPGSLWRETPGTYYWQVMAGKGIPGLGETVQYLLSPIYKFVIAPTATTKPKSPALTPAQKRAKAVANCRRRYKHNKKKRVNCEKQAKRKYGSQVQAVLTTATLTAWSACPRTRRSGRDQAFDLNGAGLISAAPQPTSRSIRTTRAAWHRLSGRTPFLSGPF